MLPVLFDAGIRVHIRVIIVNPLSILCIFNELCREYLGCEYAEKFGEPRIFSKETMPGTAPKVV